MPALPVETQADRFARPRVVLPDGIVNHALMMGSRAVALNAEQLTDTWHRLRASVYDAGLVTATHLEVPFKEEAAAGAGTVGKGGAC